MDADPVEPRDLETTEPSERAFWLEPGEQVGNWVIDGHLKSGAWGQTYIAYAATNEKKVVVKTILPEFANDPKYRRRFRREQEAFEGLAGHRNLCPPFDWNREGGVLWLAMPWIDGKNLFDLVGGAPLDPSRAADLIAQAAEGLEEVHRKTEFAHGDVHPGNLMVEGDDRLLVIDFGLAKPFGHPSASPAERRQGVWVAPEGWRGEEMTPQSDVYSLGLVFAYLLTARRPTSDGPQFPDEIPIPDRLREITLNATSDSLSKRTETAAELASQLREYLEPPPPAPPKASVPRTPRRIPALLAIMLAVVSGLVSFLLVNHLSSAHQDVGGDSRVAAAGLSFPLPDGWRLASVSGADRRLGMQKAASGADAVALIGSISRMRVPDSASASHVVDVSLPAGQALRAEDDHDLNAPMVFVFHTSRGYPSLICRRNYGAPAAAVEAACKLLAASLSVSPAPTPIDYPSKTLREQTRQALASYADASRRASAKIAAAETSADVRSVAASVAATAGRSATALRSPQLATLREAFRQAQKAWRAAAKAAEQRNGFHDAGKKVAAAESGIRKARFELLRLGYRP
jgi:serine/threonine protein kinase